MSTKNMRSEWECSSGYFGDPTTGVKFTQETKRENSCGDGFKWPTTKLSDGRIVKIVFSAFTQEEKQAYYDMRKSGKGSGPKKNELRETLLKLQDCLNEQLKGQALKDATALIDSIMPEAPQSALEKKVAKMSDEDKQALIALLTA